jgi:uncharacterized membrane protein
MNIARRSVTETAHVQRVLSHPAYAADPIAALTAHIEATMPPPPPAVSASAAAAAKARGAGGGKKKKGGGGGGGGKQR